MSLTSYTNPRWPAINWAIANLACLGFVAVLGLVLAERYGIYDPQFGRRAMEVVMGVSAMVWLFVLSEIWREKALGSRDFVFFIPLVTLAGISGAGFFLDDLASAAMLADIALWLIVLASNFHKGK